MANPGLMMMAMAFEALLARLIGSFAEKSLFQSGSN